MAKAKKKSAREASNIFHSIMKASVKDNPKPSKKAKDFQELAEIRESVEKEPTERLLYLKANGYHTPNVGKWIDEVLKERGVIK